MVVGVCGYGYTGSGAVLDFLREFDCFSCPIKENEFDITYLPHGIQDLEYQLMERRTRYLSSYVAMRDFKNLILKISSPRSIYRRKTGNRFIQRSNQLLTDLTQISWPGQIGMDKYFAGSKISAFYQSINWKIKRLWEEITGHKFPCSKKQIYISIKPDTFYVEVKKYINDVLLMLGYDTDKDILLNQPFDVFDPKRSMKFFDKPKAILVDRDPRDLYILAKFYLKIRGSFIPTSNVQDFVKYWKLIREGCTNDGNDILRISFEDMIYENEETTNKIIDFLGLDYSHKKNFYFDPDISVNNTMLFENHSELHDDIEYIRKELSQYIYPFKKQNGKASKIRVPF